MTGKRATALWWGTLTLLAVSVLVNVAQAHRLRVSVNPSGRASLLGQRVNSFEGIDRNGRLASIRFDQNVPTVLYFFSPSCAWCERNWDNVRALAGHADGRYRVIGIAAESSLDQFLVRQPLSFEVYGGIAPETREVLRLSGTPRTIVVSAQGLITNEWTGAFSGAVGVAIEDLFGIDLPGLRAPVQHATITR